MNSALQRARAAMAADPRPARPDLAAEEQRAIVGRFIGAWERADLETLAELLAADARLVMPPLPLWFDGREDVLKFLARRFRDHAGGEWRLVPTAANGQPAVGIYLREIGDDSFAPLAIGVLTIAEGRIAASSSVRSSGARTSPPNGGTRCCSCSGAVFTLRASPGCRAPSGRGAYCASTA